MNDYAAPEQPRHAPDQLEQPRHAPDQDERVIGHPAVDAALGALAEVTDATPAEQLPAYRAAHRTLREALASIDEGQPPS